jgi:hypothetical protein
MGSWRSWRPNEFGPLLSSAMSMPTLSLVPGAFLWAHVHGTSGAARFPIIAATTELAQVFAWLLRELRGHASGPGPQMVEVADIPADITEVRAFASELRRDWAAVQAGLTPPWNSGAVRPPGTSTGSRCSSARCTDARTSTCSAAASSWRGDRTPLAGVRAPEMPLALEVTAEVSGQQVTIHRGGAAVLGVDLESGTVGHWPDGETWVPLVDLPPRLPPGAALTPDVLCIGTPHEEDVIGGRGYCRGAAGSTKPTRKTPPSAATMATASTATTPRRRPSSASCAAGQ